MDCEPAATRWADNPPKGWGLSGRSLYSYCRRLLEAGYPSTLFVAPSSADAHAPLLQELDEAGIEVGVLLQPKTLPGGHKKHFGQLDARKQADVIERSVTAFRVALGERPRSARSALFSASDATFPALADAGILQCSLSNPGRRVTKHAAVWTGAPSDGHFADAGSRLQAGRLPLFELPVTTDANRVVGGIASDMRLEHSTFDDWHKPLLDAHLQRLESADVPFKALCIYTGNGCDYGNDALTPTANLLAVLTYLDGLASRYHVQPSTLAQAHVAFRALRLA